MGIAFSGKSFSGKPDGFSANDYSDEKAASLLESANAGDADAQCALCMVASLLLEHRKQLPPLLAGYIAKCLEIKASQSPLAVRDAMALTTKPGAISL